MEIVFTVGELKLINIVMQTTREVVREGGLEDTSLLDSELSKVISKVKASLDKKARENCARLH